MAIDIRKIASRSDGRVHVACHLLGLSSDGRSWWAEAALVRSHRTAAPGTSCRRARPREGTLYVKARRSARDRAADGRDRSAEAHDQASEARDARADARDERAEARERTADAV